MFFLEIIDVGVSEERKYWKMLCEEFLFPDGAANMIERREELIHIANGSMLVFSLVNILWFIVDFAFLKFNPLGFASLTLFTAIVVMQGIAMLYHRLMTISYELSRAHFLPNMSQERRTRELASIPDSGFSHGQNNTDASA